MKNQFRIANCELRIWVAVACIALFVGSASATTVIKMELPELVATSDSIVQGRVDTVESRWENRSAFTYISVRVDDPLKGDRRRSVMIRQLGGRIGALSVNVAGMPVFQPGDQVIVFLRDRKNGTFDVVGMNQGKYEIVDNVAIANVSGLTIVDEKTGQFTDAGFVDKAPLEAFKARIRGLVK